MRFSDVVLLASLNSKKNEEIQELLKNRVHFQCYPASQFVRNLYHLSIVETGKSYLENALAKARTIHHASHYPVIGDDSGLEVQALQGEPGLNSHRYASTLSQMTQDQANQIKLLEALRTHTDRTARLVCTLVFCMEGLSLEATGQIEGSIATSARGTFGFGYDALFIPHGSSKTLAEMTLNEKNTISHRKQAVDQLLKKIQQYEISFVKP